MRVITFRTTLASFALVTSALLAACGGGSASSPTLTSQTISFSPAATGTVGTPITLSATATSSLAVSFTSSTTSVCTVSGSTLTLLAAGTCTVKADQAGNSTYAAATQVSSNITVSVPATPSTVIANFGETGVAAVGFGNMDAAVISETNLATNKVLQLVKPTNGEVWAGATINTCGAGKIGTVPTLPLSSTNKTMTLRVYSPVANIPVRLKLEDASDSTHSVETEATVTTANTWETLTFNFANQATGTAALNTAYTFNKASVFPNFGTTVTAARTFWVDDLTFVGSSTVSLTCPNEPVAGVPSAAAPTPTALQANVISIYSDAYTGKTGLDTNPNWGQTTVTTSTTVAGDNVQKYANFNYQGIDFSSSTVNVSSYTSLHIDLWSANATSVDVFLVGSASEVAVAVPLTASTWKSIDIPLSSYSIDKTAIKQIKLVSTPFGATTVYMDNLYFKK